MAGVKAERFLRCVLGPFPGAGAAGAERDWARARVGPTGSGTREGVPGQTMRASTALSLRGGLSATAFSRHTLPPQER